MDYQFVLEKSQVISLHFPPSQPAFYFQVYRDSSYNPNQNYHKPLYLAQVDLISQHLIAKTEIECPQFQTSRDFADETKFQMLFFDNQLVLALPNNELHVFSIEEDTASLVLQDIFQSQFSISCLSLFSAEESESKIVFFCNLTKQLIVTTPKAFQTLSESFPANKVDKEQLLMIKLPPNQQNTGNVTDIVKGRKSLLFVAFSRGQLWMLDLAAKNFKFINLDSQDQGEHAAITCLDYEKGDLLVGDDQGRIQILQLQSLQSQTKVLFQDQISYSKVVSLKFLSLSQNTRGKTLGLMTMDGQFQLFSFCNSQLSKLAQISIFDELSALESFMVLEVRLNSLLNFVQNKSMQTLSILWPEKIVVKINKRRNTKKTVVMNKLYFFEIQSQSLFQENQSLLKVAAVQAQSMGALTPRENREPLSAPDKIFYTKDLAVHYFSVHDGSSHQLVSLAQTEIIKPENLQKVDILSLQANEIGDLIFFLLNMNLGLKEGSKRVVAFFCYDFKQKEVLQSLLLHQHLSQALLVGQNIVQLQSDQKTVLNGEQKFNTGAKVKQMFWTPFRGGQCLLFDFSIENVMRFSKNKLEKHSQDDYNVLPLQRYSLKLNYDEKARDVQWSAAQNVNENDESTIKGAVLTSQRILIVDFNLQLITQIVLKDLVTRISWFGLALLYSTERNLNFCVSEPREEPQILLSYSNEQKGTEAHVLALADRVVTYREGGEFKVRKVLMLEPLLSTTLSTNPDPQIVRNLVVGLESSQISERLIRKLKVKRFENTARYLQKQLYSTQKYSLEEIPEDQTQKQELAWKLQNEKEFQAFRLEIRAQIEGLMQRGELGKALQHCELLNDQVAAVKLLLRAQEHFQDQNLLQLFAENLALLSPETGAVLCQLLQKDLSAKTEKAVIQEKAVNLWNLPISAIFRDFKVNRELEGSEVVDKDLELRKLELAFDEAAVNYKGYGSDKLIHIVEAENLNQFLGFSSLFANQQNDQEPAAQVNFEMARKAQNERDMFGGQVFIYFRGGLLSEQLQNQEEQKEEHQELLLVGEDLQADDLEEQKYLYCYWRGEEGKGDEVKDFSQFSNHGRVHAWAAEPLEDGYPMDFEDKWGKVSQPNYAITGPVTLETKIEKVTPRNFTVEAWLLLASTTINISILASEKLAIELDLESFILQITSKERKFSFQFEGMETQQTWTHIAVSYEVTEKNIDLFINGKKLKVAQKGEFPSLELFETGQQLVFYKDLQVAEVRVWMIALNEKIVKENRRNPLPLLAEQKKRFIMQFNRSKPPPEKKGLKKLGGIGAPKKPPGSKKQPEEKLQEQQPEKKEEYIQEEVKLEQEKEQSQPEKVEESFKEDTQVQESALTDQKQTGFFDGWDSSQQQNQKVKSFGFDDFGPQQASEQKVKDDFGEFSFPENQESQIQQKQGGFEEFSFPQQDQPVSQESNQDFGDFSFPAAQPAEKNNQDFQDFGNYSEIKPQEQSDFGFQDFSQSQTKVQEPEEKQNSNYEEEEIRKEVEIQKEEDIVSKEEDKVCQEEEPQILSEGNEKEEFKEEFKEEVLRSETYESPERKKEEEEEQKAYQTPQFTQNSDIQDSVESPEAFSQETQKVLDLSVLIQKLIQNGKLEVARHYLVEHQNHLVEEITRMDRSSQQQKEMLKNKGKQICQFFLALNLSFKLKLLKDQGNQQVQIASLSNALVLLQLDKNLKKTFLQFAVSFEFYFKINSNLKVKNFQCVKKIYAFYLKSFPDLSEKERKKLVELLELCEKHKSVNMTRFSSTSCPSCEEALPFGLATPQCGSCKQKISFCMQSLEILKAENAISCRFCSAKFSRQVALGLKERVCAFCGVFKL